MATRRTSQSIHAVRQDNPVHTSGSPPSPWAVTLALLGILAAFGLRLHRLGQESLWYDEIVSVDLAGAGIRGLLEQTARDIHPPGYYLLLLGWRSVARPVMEMGHSFEFLYAFPSLAAGVLVCALVWVLARRTTSPAVAAIAVWLCALHPFQITYSQEVRMYTLGAVLCMLYVLISLHLFQPMRGTAHPQRRHTPWALFIVLPFITAAGLYTFYYFTFLIAATTLWVGIAWLRAPRRFPHSLVQWLVSHLAALVLWLPWLPTFLAQAIDPPVPPWRVAWSGLADTVQALVDLAGVYTAGHALESPTLLALPAVLAFMLFTLLGYANYFRSQKRNHFPSAATDAPPREASTFGRPILLIFALAPPALLIALSATVTPLFHTRYVYVFHAPFLILIAAAVMQLWYMRRALALFAVVAVASLCIWGTLWFWTSPTMRSDDHRAAVALLASRWQPGEVIMANAGWTYRALRVYWPQRATQPYATVPPPLSPPMRLEPGVTLPIPRDAAVPLLYTGSIDSTDNLGWNQPGADFYAISAHDIETALVQLGGQAAGLWHYRLYDTVSDPTGRIRQWFDDHARQTEVMSIPGRDYLQLARYSLPTGPGSVEASSASHRVAYGPTLVLLLGTGPTEFTRSWEAGKIGYVPILAQTSTEENVQLAASLRLIDPAGHRVSQLDVPLPLAERAAPSLSMPIPVGTPPGDYGLELVVYDIATLDPLAPTQIHSQPTSAGRVAIVNAALDLGSIQVTASAQEFIPAEILARFDYVHLLAANYPVSAQPNQSMWPIQLGWWPAASPYTDTYAVTVRWLDETDSATMQWTEPLGPPWHPSGAWQPLRPVVDLKELPLPAEGQLEPGTYTVQIGLTRAADGLGIPARAPMSLYARDWFTLGTMTVAP